MKELSLASLASNFGSWECKCMISCCFCYWFARRLVLFFLGDEWMVVSP